MLIYLYSTEAFYEDQKALGKPPMLKVGQTTQELAEVRIEQQDGTSCAQPLQQMTHAIEVGDITDHEIHAFFRTRGVKKTRVDKDREWFFIDVAEAVALINEYVVTRGLVPIPQRPILDPREYQQQFVDQFVATTGDFLLFAKCRSGKSVMGLMAAQASNFRSVLVVSLRTSAGNSWLIDPVKYRNFHEWDAIDLHDDDAIDRIKQSQDSGRRTVMVGTVQGADSKFSLQAKLKKVFPNGIDALYFDECHIGGLADMVKRLRKSINFGRCLEISGTAFKASWFYDRSNTFVWDYTKEQAAGLDLPKMNLILAKYDSSELNNVYSDDPDRLDNIWTVIDGEWQDEASVRNFFTHNFANGRVHKSRQLFRGSDHIVMSLPSVAACDLAVETLEGMNLPWAPLSITGDSGNNQRAILDHVESHNQTICFTRWANVVGVTVPQWDTVIHGCRTDSAEFWIQFSFRGGSTKKDKWKVIDFAPEQALSSILEMVQAATDASEEVDPSNALRTFLEFADVFEFDDGFTDVDYDGFIKLACDEPEKTVSMLVRRAQTSGSIGQDLESTDAFMGLKGVVKEKILNVTVNRNGTLDSSNVEMEQRQDALKNEFKERLRAIKAALGSVPTLVYIHSETNPITSVFQMLESPLLEEVTGVGASGFKEAIEGGWISQRELSAIVSQATLLFDAQTN